MRIPPGKRNIVPETVVTEEDIVEVSPRMMETLTTILPTRRMISSLNNNNNNNHNLNSKLNTNKHKYHVHKYDSEMASNEFSTEMHTPELLVIILILCLWVLSLRKLVKHFDKLRSTQYREIPYKYHLKDPENIANVKIVNNQNESVIYSRDPVKSLRSKSIACPAHSSRLNSTSSGGGGFNFFGTRKGTSAQLEIGPSSAKKKSVVDSMLLGIHYTSPSTSAKADANRLKAPTDFSTQFNYKKNLSCSLNSMSNNGAQRQCRNHSVGYLRTTLPSNNELGYRASVACYNSSVDEDPTNPNGPKLDPAYLLPVVVRRSLLDLHRKSVENLAAAAAACVPSTESMNMNKPTTTTTATTSPSSSPSKKAATTNKEVDKKKTSETAKKKRFNLASLRPPRLNLQRKSNNVKSDSSQSVKMSESPV